MFCVLIKKQIKDFFSIIPGSVDMDKVHYCERFLELLVDLEVGNIQENYNFCPTYSYCVPEIHILEIFLFWGFLSFTVDVFHLAIIICKLLFLL